MSELLTIQAEKDELEAQVHGLVETLKYAKAALFDMDNADDFCRKEEVVALGNELSHRLSILPREWLERERNREAVIQAAIAWHLQAGGPDNNERESELDLACSRLGR